MDETKKTDAEIAESFSEYFADWVAETMDDKHIQWHVDGSYIRSDCGAYEIVENFNVIPGEPWLLNIGGGYFLTFGNCQMAMYAAENDKRKKEGRELITM